ncbi:MAG: LytTR family DNA-binding domain-containing protein [Bacteroides sp.]|nr:LytTR family DNA-binding domain-containing protein [Bacteroides sp.]MCM1549429.1 LytTR family DNA-binding domain-containing protein [Clostridium sp.]
MTRNVLIVEDKQNHSDAIRKILSEMDADIMIFQAYNLEEAYHVVAEHHIHLFLLDIILDTGKAGDVSGLNLAKELRQHQRYEFTPIIFITTLEDPELYSYRQLHCFGYIEKPFDSKQIQQLVRTALNFPVAHPENKNMYFRRDGILYSIRAGDIIYIENSRRLLRIHSVREELEVAYKTAAEILEELDSPDFLQCSRYVIVNRNYIEKIDFTNRYLKLRGIKDNIEIGIIMKKQFRDRIENG